MAEGDAVKALLKAAMKSELRRRLLKTLKADDESTGPAVDAEATAYKAPVSANAEAIKNTADAAAADAKARSEMTEEQVFFRTDSPI